MSRAWRITALTLGLVITAGTTAQAKETVTFTKDVAPILYQNCVSCHRPGEVAPMALRTYDEVRPWAKAIRDVVSSRKMPPWFADPNHGTWANDARLTDEQVAVILNWVDNGSPRGNPDDLPELPHFPDGWQLGEPDFVIELPEIDVPATGPDYFPDLQVTVDIPEDRWVRAVEVRPGNRAVNHHVVLFAAGGGGAGMMNGGFFDVLAVWAVGTPPTQYPEGMGRWVRKGQRLMTNMHYHPNGQPAKDQTNVGLYFGKGELKKEITAALAGDMTFQIPARAKDYELRSSYFIDQDIHVVSFFPHMHLRGKSMSLTAHYPNGRQEVLLNVPQYDFNWQLFYYPKELKPLPKGTRVDIVAKYDNSADNPNNPDPDRPVGFGVQTTDEMMFGLFEFVAAEGVRPKPVSDESRVNALLSSLPRDEVYAVNLNFLGRSTPTALHLPRQGDGAWYIPLMRQFITVAVKNIRWDGDNVQFDFALRFGQIGGDFTAKGAVAEDGRLTAEIILPGGAPGLLPFRQFEGTRPAQTAAKAQ